MTVQIDQFENTKPVRQLVDRSAAFWAGIVSGLLFLLMYLFLMPLAVGGDASILLQYLASIVLGPETVLTAATPVVVATALVVHFVLAMIWAVIITIVIHRWGMIIGILLGGLLGLAIYGINFFSFIFLFPWFWPLNTVLLALIHVAFGAVAGGVYEYLEVEYFEPVTE